MNEQSIVRVFAIPYSNDNYAYVLRDDSTEKTAVFDCGDKKPISRFLNQREWSLDYIFVTHFHNDHSGGVHLLKKEFPTAQTIKPAKEQRLKDYDVELDDLDTIPFGNFRIQAIRVPAHTQHCTSYYIKPFIFVGDALFSGGCGRLFEGNGKDLINMIDRFSTLPNETQIFFGHEYTLNNLKFAISIDPGNESLQNYYNKINNQQGSIKTTPSTLALEKEINPFFRVDQPAIIKKVDLTGKMSRSERIAVIRKLKDTF